MGTEITEIQVKERIRTVLLSKGLNPTQLSKIFNVNQKTLNSQINGDTTLSVSTILLIIKAIPDVSTEWILRGEGKMLLDYAATPENKYFEICQMLLENRKKDAELYLRLANMMDKESNK